MRRLLSLLPLLAGCGGLADPEGYHTGDFYVTATAAATAYEGESQGVVYMGMQEGLAWTMLWPADRLEGYLFGWEPGETGSFDLSYDPEADPVDGGGYLFWTDDAGGTYASRSGSLEVASWESHEPENSYDLILGYIEGIFSGTVEGISGTTGEVEITDGAFFSMVQDQSGG